MQSTKKAISKFLSEDGKHTTIVDESVDKPVTDEHIHPHKHEKVTTAVDKEVHQDHHHVIVQPLKQTEKLPEEHTHNVKPVEQKTFHHGNERQTREMIDREVAKYQNSTVTHPTKETVTVAPRAAGEHVHHHVHEHIQPVIEKEVYVPKVVHTTIPVHEIHHAAAQHHGTTILPTKTLEEFQNSGGMLEGKARTKIDEYDSCPKGYDKSMQAELLEGDKNMHLHSHAPDSAGPYKLEGIRGSKAGTTSADETPRSALKKTPGGVSDTGNSTQEMKSYAATAKQSME